jgi:hypothetical protein
MAYRGSQKLLFLYAQITLAANTLRAEGLVY